MTWSEHRLNVHQIKSHVFFYGADWNSLRQIDPPFVPHLQSSTDTSYFPTDELDDTPDQLEQVEGVGAEKDLAFLGYAVYLFLWFVYNFFLTGSLLSALRVEFRLQVEVDSLFNSLSVDTVQFFKSFYSWFICIFKSQFMIGRLPADRL